MSNRVQLNCIVCKDNHPLWRCRVFLDKTPTDRTKIVAGNKLSFSCLKGNHFFRQCPQPRKCNKYGCNSSHNTLIHGADRVFQPRTTPKPSTNKATGSRSPETTVNKTGESSGVCSVSDVKGLPQITEVEGFGSVRLNMQSLLDLPRSRNQVERKRLRSRPCWK